MKKIRPLACFAILLLVASILNAQTPNNEQLLDSLTAALFSDSKDSIEVTAFFAHKKQNMDSIYFVRKVQPNLEIVLPLLKKIAYSMDKGSLKAVISLYDRQQSFFKTEWEPVHRNNFYACEFANKQFNILEAFEETIHSLNFGNMGLNRDAKFIYYKEYLQNQYSYYHVPGAWSEAIKGWHIYSPYYMMLRENRWVGPPLGRFTFIEPYVDDIDDLMIDELAVHFEKIDTADFKITYEQFELDNLCRIISLSENVIFNKKLIEVILADKRNKHVFIRSRIKDLIKNPAYKEEVKNLLLNKVDSEDRIVRLNSLYGLIFFHDADVIAQYQKLLSNASIGVLEKQAIESHLSILDKQLNASAEVKELGKQLLKQMKN